jgi:hypothetical protein
MFDSINAKKRKRAKRKKRILAPRKVSSADNARNAARESYQLAREADRMISMTRRGHQHSPPIMPKFPYETIVLNPKTSDNAKLEDLRQSVIELKEFAQEEADKAEITLDIRGTSMQFKQEVAKRKLAMRDMVEHCLAALEENE